MNRNKKNTFKLNIIKYSHPSSVSLIISHISIFKAQFSAFSDGSVACSKIETNFNNCPQN